MPDDRSDEDLAESVRDGLVHLWEDLARRVMRMIELMVRIWIPGLDQEDVTQDALIRFYNALPSYDRSRGTLRAFVSTLTWRQVADYYRVKGRRPQAQPLDQILELQDAAVAGGNPGGDLLSTMDGVLDAPTASVIRLRVLEGYEHRDIARQLGTSEAAVKMRIKRGLERLKRWLEDEND